MMSPVDPSLVLQPPSHIDTPASAGFETAVLAKLASNPPLLVLDFSDVAYIGSSGLRVLLIAAKRMRAAGGEVALCGVQEGCRSVLEVTGFLRFFALYPTLDDVVTKAPAPPLASQPADDPADPAPADLGSEPPGR